MEIISFFFNKDKCQRNTKNTNQKQGVSLTNRVEESPERKKHPKPTLEVPWESEIGEEMKIEEYHEEQHVDQQTENEIGQYT